MWKDGGVEGRHTCFTGEDIQEDFWSHNLLLSPSWEEFWDSLSAACWPHYQPWHILWLCWKVQVLPNPSLLALIDGISDKTFKDLSNDHQIFIGVVRIIIMGEVVVRWSSMKIGPVVTSRFTTTETRCCRLWISELVPSFELTRIVRYLIYVWAECFVTIKHRNSFLEAPRVLLLEVMLSSKHCSFPERTLLATSM